MYPELKDLLCVLRERRGFSPPEYLSEKCGLLNSYFNEFGINSVVVGVSGGVDSALVLGLLCHASSLPDSPIRKVVAALLPVRGVGTTGQEGALSRGRECFRHFSERYNSLQKWECDLSSGLDTLAVEVETVHGKPRQPWSYGQISSIVRTPVLYYIASLLQNEGENYNGSLVAGTTNRSEGAYIGFYGKASDGMVDIQPVSDLHKSEVYALSKYLGVPQSILDATPRGDVWDGRCDEQMFGTSYDFLELFQLIKSYWMNPTTKALVGALSPVAREEFDNGCRILEEVHRKNRHKYRGTPAVHFDVLDRFVPPGTLLLTR